MATYRIQKFESSFLSCERDLEVILKKLFVDSRIHSETLKRLLVINNTDCLVTDNDDYNAVIATKTLNVMLEEGYIKTAPKIEFEEHEEVKAYIVIEFNNFSINLANPQFRDCVIDFNILCHTDHWDIGDYRLRPIKIMGYIDGLLNEAKLTGIGTLNFLGANEVVIDDNLSGYLLRYSAIHNADDVVPIDV